MTEGGTGRSINLNKVSEFWKSRSLPVRAALIAFGLALVVFIIMLAAGVGGSRMDVLFSSMDPIQARAVAERLDELNVQYELADNNTTILVPRDQRDRLRLQLSPDLYAQGAGFELFESNGLLVSEFEKRAQWQLALQEELRRTIVSIDAVEEARVHLVLPEQGVFLREQAEPSASVFLRLRPLVTLSEKQVQGIVSLVAGSVENLKAENINVVDSQGNVLHSAYSQVAGEHLAAEWQKQMELRRSFERELEQRIVALLERVYGPGKALAMITAELDFDQKEETTTTYDGAVPRSEHRSEERYEGEGIPAGEAGEANIPGYVSIIGNGEYSGERIDETINYEISEVRTYLAEAPGKIVRLSAAVVVDSSGNGPQVVNQVTELVASAIGRNQERGDEINVQLMPLESPEPIDWDEILAQERFQTILRYAFIGGLVLLAFILLLVFLKRLKTAREKEEITLQEFPEIEVPEPEAAIKREQLRNLAEKEPEHVAYLLKTWLRED